MTELWPVLIIVASLLTLLAFGVWIGIVLLGAGVVTVLLYSQINFGAPMATTVWSHLSPWSLTSLPLFIWMGEVFFAVTCPPVCLMAWLRFCGACRVVCCMSISLVAQRLRLYPARARRPLRRWVK
jgi:hypothetical protein